MVETERMLLELVRIKPLTSRSPIRRASDWATKASCFSHNLGFAISCNFGDDYLHETSEPILWEKQGKYHEFVSCWICPETGKGKISRQYACCMCNRSPESALIQSHQGLHSPLTELLETVEYTDKHRRPWPDCMDEQSDLSLCYCKWQKGTFLICTP